MTDSRDNHYNAIDATNVASKSGFVNPDSEELPVRCLWSLALLVALFLVPLSVYAEDAQPYCPTPALLSHYLPDHDSEGCYFCTPMDITDEEAVWNMLISPVTVINVGQKKQITLRAVPSEDAEGIGEITGTSQSVHVLENLDDGWSLIECYSSSFHGSKSQAWNAYVTGYVRTSLLKTVTPSQHYGIVVDKLTQELYLFHDGHLMTTLVVSTGLPNEKQPYNETRSGEFLMVSRVGSIVSDRLIGAKAIRFNSGDLLHEVPYVKNGDGSKNYKTTEAKLGIRASHGCIRVQRLRNQDGLNQAWLWDNLPVGESGGTKLVIWEDFAGRQTSIPEDSTPIYYNPKGGTMYHAVANCPGVKKTYLPLTGITYGELEEGSFASLTRCPNCFPPLRKGEIAEINALHLTHSPGIIVR